MRFVFVMDPMDRILPDKDTSYAFQRAAQNRGHVSYHCGVHDLLVDQGHLFARARRVTTEPNAPYFRLGSEERLRLDAADAVFIRKDPPFDSEYLYLTLLLERVRGRTLLVNDPRGIRDANEKLYALHFSEHMPRSLVASGRDDILAFVQEVGGKAVIKPLDGAGGHGVMMLSSGDKNNRAIIDLLTVEGRRFAMVQQYLPHVVQGDKRILVLDGRVLGAINRVPRADDLRSNIHVGGNVEPTTVTPKEEAILQSMAPRLAADGLHFVGLDMIGERLTEVNVTSPTGIQELSRHVGRDVAEDVIAWTERKVQEQKA